MTDIKGKNINRTFSVAPMLDWTDRHARYFLRLISKQALLYSEMVTTGALIHGDTDRFLRYNSEEHPVALQLGGHNPKELAHCARLAETYGYDEVNLNVGCPSDRVQNGRIGACLMAEPELVADGIKAMQDATHLPVTIKHRIGISSKQLDIQSFDELTGFIEQIAATGCSTFIVHARIAILEGLSPKENRETPPLRYETVYRLKEVFPDLEIIINGGIKTLSECQQHLKHIDGTMVGREAYQNPWLLAQVDSTLYNQPDQNNCRHDVIERMYPYIEKELSKGTALNHVTRHLLGLFNGLPGARRFRRHLSENAHKESADIKVLEEALSLCPRQILQ